MSLLTAKPGKAVRLVAVGLDRVETGAAVAAVELTYAVPPKLLASRRFVVRLAVEVPFVNKPPLSVK